tara:strand:- start:24 stop:323 length:300 start_codon:yes stop_codon:yes gene_type:complete
MVFVVSKKAGPNGLLLVVTDGEIIGKTFEEGKLQLDLTKEFYQGKEMSKEEVKELFIDARDLHLTGEKAVGLGIELNYVDKEHVLYVDKIPHAEVVMEG